MKTDNLTKQEAEQAIGMGNKVYHPDTCPTGSYFSTEKGSLIFRSENSIYGGRTRFEQGPETGWRIYQPETGQHTPLLWKILQEEPYHDRITNIFKYQIYTDKGKRIIVEVEGNSKEESKANALLVIKAVNNHDALVDALKEVIKLRNLIEYPATVKPEHEGEAQAVYAMLSNVESALNKVEQ